MSLPTVEKYMPCFDRNLYECKTIRSVCLDSTILEGEEIINTEPRSILEKPILLCGLYWDVLLDNRKRYKNHFQLRLRLLDEGDASYAKDYVCEVDYKLKMERVDPTVWYEEKEPSYLFETDTESCYRVIKSGKIHSRFYDIEHCIERYLHPDHSFEFSIKMRRVLDQEMEEYVLYRDLDTPIHTDTIRYAVMQSGNPCLQKWYHAHTRLESTKFYSEVLSIKSRKSVQDLSYGERGLFTKETIRLCGIPCYVYYEVRGFQEKEEHERWPRVRLDILLVVAGDCGCIQSNTDKREYKLTTTVEVDTLTQVSDLDAQDFMRATHTFSVCAGSLLRVMQAVDVTEIDEYREDWDVFLDDDGHFYLSFTATRDMHADERLLWRMSRKEEAEVQKAIETDIQDPAVQAILQRYLFATSTLLEGMEYTNDP